MLFSSEQVSNGHPDKICDQISDAIVTDILSHDKKARIAAEVCIKDYDIIILGEITSTYIPDYQKLVMDVLRKIGLKELENYKVQELISAQSPDIAMGVDHDGAGDQGMMFGYATKESEEMLPLPYVLSTRALQKLQSFNLSNDFAILKPDAKAQVSFDYKEHRIDTFLISSQHSESVSLKEVRAIIEKIMQETAEEMSLNTDLTGRKIIADTYGGAAHHGGGAFSGKDPSKVDRSAAYMARKVARDIVSSGRADRCEVQLAYAIGVAEPVSLYLDCFGTEKEPAGNIWRSVLDSYDLTPKGIISRLDLLNVDYNLVSSYGHFGKPELPWEK